MIREVSALILAMAIVPAAASAKDRLNVNEALVTGNSIKSNDGRFMLTMQADCNLVIYKGPFALWSSKTAGRGVQCRAVMQGDDNFVVYNNANKPVWDAKSTKPIGAVTVGASVVLQDDGNLVVLNSGQVRWAANSQVAEPTGLTRAGSNLKELHANQYLDGSFNDQLSAPPDKVVMQSDCNLVVYQTRDTHGSVAHWRSDTNGKGSACKAALQADGNFVIYAGNGKAVWSSGKAGPGARLVYQGDGNLVLYSAAGKAVWATMTCGLCGATGPVVWPNGKPGGGGSAPPPAPVAPVISATPAGKGFKVTGSGFQPMATVYVRLVDDQLANKYAQGSADAKGNAVVDTGAVCERAGLVAISANDGRVNGKDVTGTLWSNTVRSNCQ